MTEHPQTERRDWLLTSVRVLVTIMMVAICITGLGLIVAALGLPFFQDKVLAEIANETGKRFGGGLIVALEAIFLIFLAFGAAAFQWLRQLRRIVDSVGEGNAFAPENAERLAQMGWIIVGIETLAIPAGLVTAHIARHTHGVHLELGFSLGGILTALVLFILARVFREGARMREDLEGTV